MLRALEEEHKSVAQKPRVMKKFLETKKAEKVVKQDNKVPSIEVEEEEAPTIKEVGNGSVSASPRNKALDKLGTRGRGGARQKKANTSGPIKKVKE